MSTIKKIDMKARCIKEQADCEFQDRGSITGRVRNISVIVISKQVCVCINLQLVQEIVYLMVQSPRRESKHLFLSISQDKHSRSFKSTLLRTFIITGHEAQKLIYLTSHSIPTFCVTCPS